MPAWEIIEWNEGNVNLDCCPFCRQAYDAGMYAFASDALRFDILCREGGLYLDTDVRMLKSMEPLASQFTAFAGMEGKACIVNPGLGFYAAQPDYPIYKEMRDMYRRMEFRTKDEDMPQQTVGLLMTERLCKDGYVCENRVQPLSNGLVVLPREYLAPVDDIHSYDERSANTVAIHLYGASWRSRRYRNQKRIRRLAYRLFGAERIEKTKRRMGEAWKKR